jgi:hypothetical protein
VLAVVLAFVLLLVAVAAIGQIRHDLAETCPGGWDSARRVDAARAVASPEQRNVELVGNSYQFDGSVMMHMHWAEAPRNPFQQPELGLSVTAFARDVEALDRLDPRCIRATGEHGSWSRVAHKSDLYTQPLAGRVYRFNGACCGPDWPRDSLVRLELLLVARGDLYRIDLGELPVISSD